MFDKLELQRSLWIGPACLGFELGRAPRSEGGRVALGRLCPRFPWDRPASAVVCVGVGEQHTAPPRFRSGRARRLVLALLLGRAPPTPRASPSPASGRPLGPGLCAPHRAGDGRTGGPKAAEPAEAACCAGCRTVSLRAAA